MNASTFESPSLQDGGREAPAYEVKFLLPHLVATAIENRLRIALMFDPFGNTAQGCGYTTTTVYFDTAAFDVFHRRGSAGRCKFRLRRYGNSDVAFVERKIKRGSRVRKRRTPLALEDLPALPRLTPELPVGWFARQIRLRGLQPACRICYRRIAFVGVDGGEPIRATFDRDIVGFDAAGASFDPIGRGEPLPIDGVVAEFKFRRSMPLLFKSLVEDFGLSIGATSKYRTCIETLRITDRKEIARAWLDA